VATRKTLTPVQKVAIIRKHLLETVPLADLCGNRVVEQILAT